MAGDKSEPTPRAPAASSSERSVDDFNLFTFSVDEMAQWRKDAMRYRFLRSADLPHRVATSILNDSPEGIDAAVDAAMK